VRCICEAVAVLEKNYAELLLSLFPSIPLGIVMLKCGGGTNSALPDFPKLVRIAIP
jgi:hypothetical protein